MQTLFENTQAFRLLKTEWEENRLGHAYLLLLNDARNLRFALKTFAKVVFGCVDGEKERIALRIDDENFSDCLCFPESDKKLTVEDAERIAEESLLHPLEGEKKVFLISDFADANIQTQNKLLKLLEEPPQGVVFLLGATSVFPVLPTVLSRTEKLEIQPFSAAELSDCLYRIYGEEYPRESLQTCAIASGGCLGEAQNILEGGYYKALSEGAFALALTTEHGLPATVKAVGETKYKKELLALLRMIFRDATVLKTGLGKGKNLLLRSEETRIRSVAEKYGLSALLYAQEAISSAEKETKFNAVFPQCIELCMARIFERNKV